VQFGEGGAGTFSDGKLHSQIKDPKFYGRKVLTEFVKAGAPEEIMYVSKPHIGTFRLVGMVEEMRHEMEALGAEIRFQSRVADIEIGNGQVCGVVLADGTRSAAASVHIVGAKGKGAWLKVIMHEGKKREIREITRVLALPVVQLIRVRIASLLLGAMKPGQARQLTPAEVSALKDSKATK